MKCVFKVLCSLGFAIGVMVAVMNTHGLAPECAANWTVLSWGLIGFAIGALISIILNRACGKSSCDTHHH